MTDDNGPAAGGNGKRPFIIFNIIMLIAAITAAVFINTLYSSVGDSSLSSTLKGISPIFVIWVVGIIILLRIQARKNKQS